MLVPIRMATSMVCPYKSLLISIKHFSGYLVGEILLWPWILARVFAHWHLLSFPRFWTLPIEWFWFWFWSWMAWNWKPAMISNSPWKMWKECTRLLSTEIKITQCPDGFCLNTVYLMNINQYIKGQANLSRQRRRLFKLFSSKHLSFWIFEKEKSSYGQQPVANE